MACAWRPREEGTRWLRLRPLLEACYASLVIVVPFDADLDQAREVEAALGVTVAVAPQPFWARHVSLRRAVEGSPDEVTHVHYADGDRLLHWIETRPEEWRATVAALTGSDYLTIGRSAGALRTHPQAMQQTEGIVNAVASYLLGQPVDVGGGSRGLSRRAARTVLANCAPGQFGDASWPIVVKRAGFRVDACAVDGLDWESPDHYRERVADAAAQLRAAQDYDQRADRWAARVRTAAEIVGEALAAAQQPLSTPGPATA